MYADRFVKFLLVCITFLLGLIALRPMVGPLSVRAQNHHEYRLVSVLANDAPSLVEKYTKEGWEPVALSFYMPPVSNPPGGFVLFRK